MALSTAVGTVAVGTGLAGTTYAVTGLGFQPKAVLFFWNGRTESIDTQGEGDIHEGFGIATSPSSRSCVTSFSVHNSDPTFEARGYNPSACIAYHDASAGGNYAGQGQVDLQSMDAGGFTLVVDVQLPVGLRVGYLALGGSDVADVYMGTFTGSAALGTQNVVDANFQPDAVILAGIENATIGAGLIEPDVQRSVALVADSGAGIQQAVFGFGAKNGFTSTRTAQYGNDTEAIISWNNTLQTLAGLGTVAQMLSTGFQLNWTDASGAKWLYLAIRGPQFSVQSFNTQTDTVTPIAVTGAGFTPVAGMVLSHGTVESTSPTVQEGAMHSIGAFTATAQVAHGLLNKDGVGISEVATAIDHGAVYVSQSTADPIVKAGSMVLDSLDADGVTFLMDDADPAAAFGAVLLIGAADVNTPPSVTINEKATIGTVRLQVGGTYPLTATVTDAEDEPDPSAAWESSNTGVATVNPTTGVVTAIAEGSCTVTATATDLGGSEGSDSIPVVVDNTPSGFSPGRFIIHALGGIA